MPKFLKAPASALNGFSNFDIAPAIDDHLDITKYDIIPATVPATIAIIASLLARSHFLNFSIVSLTFSTLASSPVVSILFPKSISGIFAKSPKPKSPIPLVDGVDIFPELGVLPLVPFVPAVVLTLRLFISSNPLINPFISFLAFLAAVPVFFVALVAFFNELEVFFALSFTLFKELLRELFDDPPNELLTFVAPCCALPKSAPVIALK